MVNNNKAHRPGIRAALSSALFLVATSASAVTVDGNLGDLIAAIGSEPFAPQNTASVTESGSDAESNGFDIVNGYAWYNGGTDTFFIGMNFAGPVGTAGGLEGAPTQVGCGQSPNFDGVAGIFDGCERYGFAIDIDADATKEFDLLLKGDGAIDSGLNTESAITYVNNTGLSVAPVVNWNVSETNDGVEFSITGLRSLLEPFGPGNPRDVDIILRAGSITNVGLEDTLVLHMQVVPLPAAVWLFGSGLIGLLGLSTKSSRK
jgi:hypothetical protein